MSNQVDLQKNSSSQLGLIICLTLIFLAAQLSFFIIHYKVSDLFGSVVQSSLKLEIFHAVILLPILGFLIIQLLSYCLFVAGIWFVAISISALFCFSSLRSFLVSVITWFISCSAVLCLNNYFFPDSFFANLFPATDFFLISMLALLSLFILLAYYNFFKNKQHRIVGSLFLLLGLLFGCFSCYDKLASRPALLSIHSAKPNIILIGLDSLRPDFTSYLGQKNSSTPNIDGFLKTSATFTKAYTPLARTFPAWMSILTSLYPKHNGARSNLSDPSFIHSDETLEKRLKENGYETIYGTDEKRFSNITEQFDFDQIIGPRMGANDFILGGLSDFPLTNLLINTGPGRLLFPYNYANRAAAITYEPEKFLQLIKLALKNRPNKPLFLAVHLCISHWPYQWARDQQAKNLTQAQKYQSSVQAVDKQLGELLQILKENGLLQSSLVVLLSDHGTTVGLLGDRIISEKNYQGKPDKKKLLVISKLGNAPDFSVDFKKDYSLNTSYGQGTDVLSLKQYHVLLAFKGFGINIIPNKIKERVSLLDIAPTILSFLQLKSLQQSDGISLNSFLLNTLHPAPMQRPLFLETGYCISEIENKNIFIEQVVKHAIGAYQINPKTGLLFLKTEAEQSIIQSKQRAILLNNWLLARYPEKTHVQLVSGNFKYSTSPAFFVIVNVRTGQWDIGLDTTLAKQAHANELLKNLNDFYADEALS